MNTLRKAKERHRHPSLQGEIWCTFDRKNRADPSADGFGALKLLNEDRLPPIATVPRQPTHDAQILTYVREGTLAYEDSKGRVGVLHAGEFQRMTAGRGIRHSERNASLTDWAHVFQIWLRPSEAELNPEYEQKRIFTGKRRGALCVVASPDGRRGSLRIHVDAFVYSALLDPGQHVVHELLPGRCAWLHLVQGEATLVDIVLTTGDGAGFTAERTVSCTAREATEILLFDLAEHPPGLSTRKGPP